MNTKKIASLLLLTIMTFSHNAYAGFIPTDWKVEGDSQALLQEETGIEWLRLNNTSGLSINQALSDITFEGWRLPSIDELDNFFASFFEPLIFGSSTSYRSTSAYRPYTSKWIHTMGTSQVDNTYERSYGYHLNDNGLAVFSGVSQTRYTNSLANIWVGSGTPTSLDTASAAHSVFLVSDGGMTLSSQLNPTLNINNANFNSGSFNATSVPEPASLAVLLAGLLGLVFTRRRKDGSALKN